jgi:hypothetical protein
VVSLTTILPDVCCVYITPNDKVINVVPNLLERIWKENAVA